MHDPSTSHLKAPANDPSATPVRVVLVGETGLDAAVRDEGFEPVRTRTALEAVGEIATPIHDTQQNDRRDGGQADRRTLVIVGPDAEPNGSLGAFLGAVRSADPSARIARAQAGDEAIRDGYDAVINADATPATLRRLVARDRSGDTTARDTRPDDPIANPLGACESAAMERESTKSVSPPPADTAEVKPIAAPVQPAVRPESQVDPKPIAPVPAKEHGDSIGDAPLLAALQRSRAALLDAALPLMARRLGVGEVAFVEHGMPDTDMAPVPSFPVAAGGKRFGVIRIGRGDACGEDNDPTTDSAPSRTVGIDTSDLAPHAEWLATWLALHDRQQSLRRAAFTDPLTGAWNRRYFDSFLEAALERARYARRTVTVLIFDIDGFKRYNDDFGHPAGDEILIETVRALKGSVRPSDRVCRIGGDEFAVIFDEPEGPRVRGSRPPESVYVLAKRVQRQIGEKKFPKLGDDAPGQLTISGGLAAFPWDGHDAETLLKKADDLACDSKRRGKNAISLGPGAERVCKNAGDDFVD